MTFNSTNILQIYCVQSALQDSKRIYQEIKSANEKVVKDQRISWSDPRYSFIAAFNLKGGILLRSDHFSKEFFMTF